MQKALIQLVSRIIGFKALSFNGSQVFLLGVPMVVLPMDTFAKFQQNLVKKYGYDEIYSLFMELGELQGFNGSSIYIKKYNIKPDMSDFSFFLEQTKLVGVGDVRIDSVDVSKKHVQLSYYNSPESIKYKEIYGIQKNPVDAYQVGLIAGSAQAILNGKDLVGIETKCLAEGNEKCLIEVKESSEWKSDKKFSKYIPKIINEIEEIRARETTATLLEPVPKSSMNPETELSIYLKRRLKNETFQFSSSGISILGVTGLITPIEILSILGYVLAKRFGKDALKIAYETGKEEGKKSMNYMGKQVSLKNNSYGLARACEIIGIYGFGKSEIFKADLIRGDIVIKVYENYLARKYQKFFGTQKQGVDNYLSGIIAGILSELLQANFDVTEKSCIAEGNPCCIFEAVKNK
jgi:predicted hydrocarbon binding protein